MDDFMKRAVKFLGSFELAFVLLILLAVLTFVGTLEQTSMSLYDVQVKYFESIVLVYWVGGVFPVPLLGGYLLLSIFFVNILVGGILRIRKGKSTVGILIAHVGIVLLLLGSFVEHQLSTKGQMLLWEGETGSSYQSSNEWEVAIREVKPGGAAREFVVPYEHIEDLDDGGTARYRHADLPFELVLSGYAASATPRPARGEEIRLGAAIDGFVLEAKESQREKDVREFPGLTATLHPKGGAKAVRAHLWGRQRMPWAVTLNGTQYQFDLRPRSWPLDFAIHLKDFVVKHHPGTMMPKEFSSYVTKIQDGKVQEIHITMNEPLRHEGVTLYQSGWGPEDRPATAKLYSVFSVVENPSDQVPLYACLVIAFGLLWHFFRRLFLHLKAESRRRANAAKGASA